MRNSMRQQIIKEFAENVKNEGFNVHLCKNKSYAYGVIGNDTRVIYFQLTPLGSVTVSGLYEPSAKCGAGWGIGEVSVAPSHDEISKLLNTNAPRWANPRPAYETLDNYVSKHGGQYAQF